MHIIYSACALWPMQNPLGLRKMKNYLHVFSFVIAINGAWEIQLVAVGKRSGIQIEIEMERESVRER